MKFNFNFKDELDLQLFANVVVPSNAEGKMMGSTIGYPSTNDARNPIDLTFQKANDAEFVEIHKEALEFDKYIGSVNLPANSGGTVRFPIKHRIPSRNTKLAEGMTPDPSQIKITSVNKSVEQHGDYVLFTDVALGTSVYDLMNICRDLQAYQSAEVKNALIRDDILAGDGVTVYYADSVNATTGAKTPVTSFAQIDETCKLTVDVVRKMIAVMKRNNIKPLKGKDYVLFIHPDQWYDLTSDPAWAEIYKYTDSTPLEDGELGRISGCRFVESTTVLVTKDGKNYVAAQAPTADDPDGTAEVLGKGVYHSIMLGADAVDQIKVAGGGIKTIAKGLGSGGVSDPLDQRATVGWKMFHGCCVKDGMAVIELVTGSFNSEGITATDDKFGSSTTGTANAEHDHARR